MTRIEAALDKLAALPRAELEELMLAASLGHAAVCGVASEDQDEHASRETMLARVQGMDTTEMLRALAPMAALAELVVGGHHAQHAGSHEH